MTDSSYHNDVFNLKHNIPNYPETTGMLERSDTYSIPGPYRCWYRDQASADEALRLANEKATERDRAEVAERSRSDEDVVSEARNVLKMLGDVERRLANRSISLTFHADMGNFPSQKVIFSKKM